MLDGHEVHLLVRQSYQSWRIEAIRAQVRLHHVNLDDEEALTQVVGHIRPEWVFHLAAHGAYPYQTDVRRMVHANVTGTMHLVSACLTAGFEALVNTGSSSEYGFKNHAPSETEWLEPNSYYAVTKASATLFCRHTAQSLGVHLPTLRLYSVYGPYEEPSRLIPTLITRGVNGEMPPLANPDIARDYVYVEDVIDAYLLAANRPDQEPGAVYNVGTGIQTSLRQVVDVARSVLQIAVEPQWGSMPNRVWDTNVWVSNNKKIRAALGWEPHHTFERGFRLMADWIRDNPAVRGIYCKPV